VTTVSVTQPLGAIEAAAGDDRIAEDLNLARSCASDVRAREAFFCRYVDTAFALARKIAGNTADAEDIVQEVFVEAFKSLKHYRGEAPLEHWLKRLIVRTGWRHVKRLHDVSRRNYLRMAMDESDLYTSCTASSALDGRAALRRLYELLDRINPRRRMVFVLYHVDGHTLADCAALLGISVTAAKKLVWRARNDLEKLARHDPLLGPFFHREDPR